MAASAAQPSDNKQEVSEAYVKAVGEIKYHQGQKTKWLAIAIDALITSNYPRQKISSKLKRDLEGFCSDELIQKYCALEGCTEQAYNPHLEQEENLREPLLVSATQNGSNNTTPDSSAATLPPLAPAPIIKDGKILDFKEPPRKYSDENKLYIEHLQRKVALFEDIIRKLKHEPFMQDADTAKPNLTPDDLQELDEFMQLSNQLEATCRQAFDDRNTVPTVTQFYLVETVAHTSIKHATGMYLAKVKQLASLSSKQVTKTLKGVVRDVHYLYEPTTKDEALLDGFYGEPCTVCGSWRVRYDFGVVHCYHCEADYHVQAKPLAGAPAPEKPQKDMPDVDDL